MTIGMGIGMARRLVEAAGGEEEAIVACWRLARANGWQTQAARAEAFIATPPRDGSAAGTALHVGWHGEEIGALLHDGSAWLWAPAADGRATPVRASAPDRLVPFIESLLAEGWLERVPRPKSQRERASAGKRYTSNVTVSENPDDLRALPADALEGRLEAHANEGAFAGGYAGRRFSAFPRRPAYA